jgi:hypothetical protein
MIHSEWTDRLLLAIESQDDRQLEILLKETESASSQHVGDWHVWQLLEVLIDRQEAAQDTSASMATHQRLVDELLKVRKEINVTLGTSCANLALKLFDSNKEKALSYSKLAFECLGKTLDPSIAFEKLIESIKNVRENEVEQNKGDAADAAH